MLSVPAFARPADVSSSSGEHVALADSLIGTSPPRVFVTLSENTCCMDTVLQPGRLPL